MFQRHDTSRFQPPPGDRPAPSSGVFAVIPGLDEDAEDVGESDEVGRRDDAELWKMQIEREQRSQAEACEKYCKVSSLLRLSFMK